jgi:predicted nucleic acid-binding protein
VQLVVADTTVLFPGLIDPDSLYRKLLVVFAWGKLHADLSAVKEEQAEIDRLLARSPDTELGGHLDQGQLEAEARQRIALIDEHLPAQTPQDFGLVISPPITQEVLDITIAERSALGGRTPELAHAAVASAAAVSTAQIVNDFDDVPHYTEGRDRKDDPIIHTAVLAGAEWILSQDKKHIALDHRTPTIYAAPHTRRQHKAVSLGYFLNEVLCSGVHFSIDDLKNIDGRLLGLVVQATTR